MQMFLTTAICLFCGLPCAQGFMASLGTARHVDTTGLRGAQDIKEGDQKTSKEVVTELKLDLKGLCDGPRQRTALLHVGSGNEESLVVNMHFSKGDPDRMNRAGGDKDCRAVGSAKSSCTFTDLALAQNFMVVFPVGFGTTFNGGPGCCEPREQYEGTIDDTCFIRQLVDGIKSSYRSVKNIFATGFSNGGVMSWRLACELPPGYLTAIAPVHGVLGGSTHLSCRASADDPLMNATVKDPGFECPSSRAVPTFAWTGNNIEAQTWMEVIASADRFRAMFSERLQNYPRTAQVSFTLKHATLPLYTECRSTATQGGAGNVTHCLQYDLQHQSECDVGCSGHRFPNGGHQGNDSPDCSHDGHAALMILNFFASQISGN